MLESEGGGLSNGIQADQMEQVDRSFIATLQLLRSLHETDIFEFELGLPTIDLWEASFEDPRSNDNYVWLEAAHVRLMYSQKRLQEVRKRLYFPGPHEFLVELHKLISSWVSEREKTLQWLESEDGEVEDEQTEIARAYLTDLEDWLEEIGSSCPFRSPSNEDPPSEDALPTYDQLSREMRVRLLSALARYAVVSNELVLEALHEGNDITEVARNVPLGRDKAGNAYFWFQDIAPYRIYRETYPPKPAKPKKAPKATKKAPVEKDTTKADKSKTSGKASVAAAQSKDKSKSARAPISEPASKEKQKATAPKASTNASKGASSGKPQSSDKAKAGDQVKAAKSGRKDAQVAKELTKQTNQAVAKTERFPSKAQASKSSESSRPLTVPNLANSQASKKKDEDEVRFTSSGRVIRLPPPIQQFTQPISKRSKPSAAEEAKNKPAGAKKAKVESESDGEAVSEKEKEPSKKSPLQKPSGTSSVAAKQKKASPVKVDGKKLSNAKETKEVSKTKSKGSDKSKANVSKDTVVSEQSSDEDDKPTVDSRCEVVWLTIRNFECVCKDAESLQAFHRSLLSAKEDEDLVYAVRRITKWADELQENILAALEDAAKAREKAIKKYQLQLVYEDYERQRKANNQAFRNADPNAPMLSLPFQLRRSGRVTKPTTAAIQSKGMPQDSGSSSEESSSEDEGASNAPRPSSGTRRSSRLARRMGYDVSEDQEESSPDKSEEGDVSDEEDSRAVDASRSPEASTQPEREQASVSPPQPGSSTPPSTDVAEGPTTAEGVPTRPDIPVDGDVGQQNGSPGLLDSATLQKKEDGPSPVEPQMQSLEAISAQTSFFERQSAVADSNEGASEKVDAGVTVGHPVAPETDGLDGQSQSS
jgi:hypothetical protein